ncbi:MAG: AMP-dependent synthetase/ligase [Bacteroidota bacterium]
MEFRRLFEILSFQNQMYPQKVAIASKEGKRWKSYSTEEALEVVQQLSAGLLDLGLKKGDRVGIMSYNGSAVWNLFDQALLQIGMVVVPIHATCNPRDLAFILTDAEVKCCLASDLLLCEKLKAQQTNAKSLRHIYSIQEIADFTHWKSLLKVPIAKHLAVFETMRAAIHEDDLATIIYTSGTTGNPKGVMLSHKNIISNIKAIISLAPVNCDKRVFSFLPLSHVFERMATYFYMAVGASIYYAERPETILSDMATVKPHYMTSVPRFLEKIYNGVEQSFRQKSALVRKVFRWAIDLGKRYEERRNQPPLYWLKLKLADLLFYRRLRGLLGGRLEGIIVGAAALPPHLARLFCAAGLEVREGYGLTETSPVLTFNRFEPGGVRFGTVGTTIPGVELRIHEPDEEGNGEIVVRGPNVMLGYYKRNDLTEAVKNEDGWFYTGDVGRIVYKRFLKITDRKKDIFKTTSGKYVAPLYVENHLRQSAYIDQCMVIGFNRPFVSALIIPDFIQLEQWCIEHDVHWTAPQYMVLNPRVVQFYDELVVRLNQDLKKNERVRKFLLLHENWTEEKGELTLTAKLRRSSIVENNKKAIDALYPS